MPGYVNPEKCDGCKALDKTACQHICPNDLMALPLAFNHDGQVHLSCKALLSSSRYPPAHFTYVSRLRREFLDPFFGELGWDMDNRHGYAESYKDVIYEDSIKDGAGTKAPDYCFRIGGTRKFFVEAKKPAVNIRDDVSPAYQLRRYAWTAKLPVSLLTDFEEFAVYDCRVRPHVDDKASVARIRYLTYPDYIH
jgi:Type I restriction enzyme R protein N terminus (HSDR_N)